MCSFEPIAKTIVSFSPSFYASCARKGLVDTAVKTAETGYMQRRLVKVVIIANLNRNLSGLFLLLLLFCSRSRISAHSMISLFAILKGSLFSSNMVEMDWTLL